MDDIVKSNFFVKHAAYTKFTATEFITQSSLQLRNCVFIGMVRKHER